mgnify:CR=1 FL=1
MVLPRRSYHKYVHTLTHSHCVHQSVKLLMRPPARMQPECPMFSSHMVDIKLPIRDIQSDIIDPLVRSIDSSSSSRRTASACVEELAIDTHSKKKQSILLLDSITSNTAIAMPIKEICRQCRAVNPDIIIIIDGAHALFTVPIYLGDRSEEEEQEEESLSSLIDIYITNNHKWMCSTKGSGLLWMKDKYSEYFDPLVVSHGYIRSAPVPVPVSGDVYNMEKKANTPSLASSPQSHGDEDYRLLNGLVWDGCRDYNSILSLPLTILAWNLINYYLMLNDGHSIGEDPSSTSSSSTTTPKVWNGPQVLQNEYIRSRNNLLLRSARMHLIERWSISDEDFPYMYDTYEPIPMTLV